MPPIEYVVALLVVTIPLVAIARRTGIPYPVVLIVGGLALGFVPELPRIERNPDPGDDYLIALATAAAAQYLVSGDAHLTDLRGSQSPVVTPRGLVTLLEKLRT